MGIRIGIAGASGYVGGELLRLLLGHPEVEIGTLAGASSAGTVIERHHPHLVQLAGRKISKLTSASFDDDDVVFLALPHGHSAEIASDISESKVLLDCGADFRLADPQSWARFYGGEHHGFWPYGLPELPGARAQLRGARRVAVPGCYPTASALAMWPALANGLIDPDVTIVAASGTSGAGRDPKPHLLGSEVMGSMSAYGVGGVHRHVPEIREIYEAVAGQPVNVSFTPTLAPMPRGILATCVAPVKPHLGADVVRNAYEHAYASEPFVQLLNYEQWPTTAATLGANVGHVQVTLDHDAGRLVAICAIDNLVKGTAGQALQCMNLALGIEETIGIPSSGLAP